MTSTIQTLILLLAVVVAVAIIANRLKIPPAILLVITGVLLALVPGLPRLVWAGIRARLFGLTSWATARFLRRGIRITTNRITGLPVCRPPLGVFAGTSARQEAAN
jgi:Kef-type K+ transport system membrane component KefB